MNQITLGWLGRFLRLNYYDDSVANVRAKILNALLLTLTVGAGLFVIVSIVSVWLNPTAQNILFVVLDGVTWILIWMLRGWNKAGYTRRSSIVFLFFSWMCVSALLFTNDRENVLLLYIFLTVIASFILTPIASLAVLGIVGIQYLVGMYFGNLYDPRLNFISVVAWFVIAVCAWLIARELERSLEIIHATATQLEQRVHERTGELLAANAALAQEIAEHKRTTDRLQLVLEASEDGFWDWNVQSNQVYHSRRYAEMLGYTPEELDVAFETWRQRVHPDDQARTHQAFQDHQAGQTAQYVCEYRQRTKTGEWLWVLDRGKIIERASDGTVLRMVGVQTDISARKQIEHALRTSEERLQLLFQATQDGFWDSDLVTGDTLHSPRYAEMLGYTLEDFEANHLPWELRVHPEDSARANQAYQDHIAGHAPFYLCEYREQMRSGDWLWILDRGKVVEWDAQGKPCRVVGVHTDISALKQIEQALRESEERLQLMFEATQDGFWDWNVQTHHHIRSQGYARMLGYTQQELEAESSRWHARIHPDDYALVVQTFEDHLVGRTPIYINEHRQRTKTGEWLWVLDRGKVVSRDAEGKPLRVVGVQSNIVARKQAEQVLRQQTQELAVTNAELAKANQLKDEFLASMSHELRTPLNTILGMTETLQENVYGTLNPEQARALGYVTESGKHLLALINDILDLSKIQAGKLELDRATVVVEQLGQASLRFIKQLAQKNQLQVHFEISPNEIYLQADERRLKQALVNLLSNAVKFTPPGGKVGLAIHAEIEKHKVHFTVWDTGIGIAPDDQTRLFQPFVQLDSRLARQYSGTGLGLALVARIVGLHGGEVTVESTPGIGSRFTISLPWDGRTSLDTQHTDPVSLDLSSWEATNAPLVLLADDNIAMCQWLGDFLQTKSLRVVSAHDGYQAIQMATEQNPAIILMDIQMPNLDGLDAIRRIRATPALTTTPIIALTALAMPGDAERCLQAGATTYLAKPVVLNELLNTLQMHLKGHV